MRQLIDSLIPDIIPFKLFRLAWAAAWMRCAGLSPVGRLATWLATWFAPPHKARQYLARLYRHGYVAPSAVIYHRDLHMGAKVFIDDRAVIFQRGGGGPIHLGDRVAVLRDVIMETGCGGSLSIGTGTWIHPRCQIMANVAPIRIGNGVAIAPNCAIYSYDHGIAPNEDILSQPLQSKGPVIIGDGAWLGFGVIVLSGVRIGKGAVIGAGSVVTRDVPNGAIAVGVPAHVVKMRSQIVPDEEGTHGQRVSGRV
jgi:acetyltransferase-like isoleucine patch superfamily enzyme